MMDWLAVRGTTPGGAVRPLSHGGARPDEPRTASCRAPIQTGLIDGVRVQYA
jgi:hypothetical protein